MLKRRLVYNPYRYFTHPLKSSAWQRGYDDFVHGREYDPQATLTALLDAYRLGWEAAKDNGEQNGVGGVTNA